MHSRPIHRRGLLATSILAVPVFFVVFQRLSERFDDAEKTSEPEVPAAPEGP
jgi:hypothetical protein